MQKGGLGEPVTKTEKEEKNNPKKLWVTNKLSNKDYGLKNPGLKPHISKKRKGLGIGKDLSALGRVKVESGLKKAEEKPILKLRMNPRRGGATKGAESAK